MKTILLVEDDRELSQMIAAFLSDEGFLVEIVANGRQAIERILADQPDLVLLDINLPEVDGITVAQTVRPSFAGVIVMLTAKDDDITEVNALNRGADAFLEKPVRPHVLLAHIRSQLRRIGDVVEEDASVIRIHDLEVRCERQEAYLDGRLLDLSSAELQLLIFFVEHPGELVTRDQLYQSLRGIEYDGIDRAMDMRISTLRRKMGDDNPPYRYIKTVRSKGYMLAR